MTTAIQEKLPANIAPEDEIHPPRLAYNKHFDERFGVNRAGWNAIVNVLYPHARTVDTVMMVLSYCQVRKLDVFKRPVHIVPMWDSKSKTYVDTIWPGIAELRTTAFRTEQYAGCDEAAFGPDVQETFIGKVGRDDAKREKSVTVVFPEWCRMTVYRLISGHRVPFVGPKTYWKETYARIGGSEIPNEMWAKRTRGQIEKCAEAAALRKAFPEELGGLYAAEEMEGQRLLVDSDAKLIEHESRAAPTPEAGVAEVLDAFGAAEEQKTKEEPKEPQSTQKRASKDIKGGIRYSEEDSGAHFDALMRDLAEPMAPNELYEFVRLNSATVQRMIPEHHKKAEARLRKRSNEILLEGDEQPTFTGKEE